MRWRSISVVTLIGALGAAACTPPPDYLFVDPHAQPVRVELRRSFGAWGKHYEPVAIGDCRFYEPAEAGTLSSYPLEVWHVLNLGGGPGVPQLRYGEVPPGFVQSTPEVGAPKPLEPGRRYTVECTGEAVGAGDFVVPRLLTRPAPPLYKREP